ncbi:MAG: hypothetical protein V4497_10815 [Bacteroidota bacterium]
MKKAFKVFCLLLVLVNSSCNVKMVRTTNDVHLLKENEQKFINKPLNKLLKEIKPEIKSFHGNNEEGYQFFSFSFRTVEQIRKNQGNWKDKVGLYIYVTEPIDWQFEKRPKGQETVWSKEDAKKYGNLIVTRIKVINKPKE